MIRQCKRNQFLKFHLNCEGDDDNGAGGGNGDGNDGKGNNVDDNLTVDDTFWLNEEPELDSAVNQKTQTVQQPSNEGDKTNSFDEHVAGMDFLDGVDVNAGMTAITNNDSEAFTKMLQQVGANAYRQSMIDSNTVIQKRLDASTKTMREEQAGNVETSKIIDAMNTAMPFTKNAMHAPVAKAILTQALQKKGATQKTAIVAVKKYYDSLSGEVSKLNPKPPNSRPSASGFGGDVTNAGENNDDDEPDWVDFMTAGNKQSS